jgi:hypothetical protein
MNAIQVEKRAMIFLLIVLLTYVSQAQVYSNDAGTREKLFIYEVKQIDEFFERFNDAPESFIRDVYKQRRIAFTVSRPKLIKSLFNYDTGWWNTATVDSFTAYVCTPSRPVLLDFAHHDWFAEARCLFQTSTTVIEIPVVLQVVKDERNGLKWIITAIGDSEFSGRGKRRSVLQETARNRFINPASHGTNFIELGKALEDKQNLSAYFSKDFFNRKNAPEFYSGVYSGAITFMYVKDVKYHFLQVDNWIFTTEYFDRKSLNSGWLVSKLIRSSANSKEIYRSNLLGSTLNPN